MCVLVISNFFGMNNIKRVFDDDKDIEELLDNLSMDKRFRSHSVNSSFEAYDKVHKMKKITSLSPLSRSEKSSPRIRHRIKTLPVSCTDEKINESDLQGMCIYVFIYIHIYSSCIY